MSIPTPKHATAPAVVFKRGNTFALTIVYKPAVGEPATLEGAKLSLNVRNLATGASVGAAVATYSPDFLIATFKIADTSKWLLGLADWDVRFLAVDGTVTHTKTRHLDVIKAVTGE